MHVKSNSMTEPKRIEYDHTLKNDKHFFGGYFNLAWNNITLISESCENEFKEENVESDAKEKKTKNITDVLRNLFLIKGKQITQLDFEDRADYLKRYFPIVGLLKYIHFDKNKNAYQIDKFITDLNLIILTMENLRDFYSHYYHAPFDVKKEDNSLLSTLYPLLDKLLLEVIEMINKNKKGDDKTQELLKDSLRKELGILCKEKKAWMKSKGFTPDTESVNNAVFNDAFNHMRYKPKNKKQFELSRYYQSQLYEATNSENGMCLSQSAIVFLLSAFLSKKEGEEFRGRLKGFKAKVICNPEENITRDNNSLRFMATHWVYSWAAFKGYKKKLNTDYLKETLLVQIMDELSKVPDSVYEVLGNEDRKRFLEDINEFVQEYDEAKSLSEATVIHPVIRKRYEDKFNYFVIRYLDEFVSFPSLRFQVHLGNYVHDRRDKKVVVGETSREIKEKINVFGKLSELSKLKVENLNTQENSMIGWELFPNPSYNFVGNNVPIYITWNSETKNYKQTIDKYRKERNKAEGRTQRVKGKTRTFEIMNELGIPQSIALDKEPTAVLSLNELPSLLYELLCNHKKPQEIEEILLRKLEEKVDLLESFPYSKEKKDTKQKFIPKTLQKAIRSEQIDRDKLSRAIKSEIEQTQKRLEILEASKTEKGEYRLKKEAKGEMAAWMAKDLIRLMPMPNRANWKGYHHRQLQASLAFYHKRERRDAVDLLCSVWDFKEDKDFNYKPELKRAFDSAFSFEELLVSYFSLRKSMLNTMGNTASVDNTKLFSKRAKQQRIWTFFNKRLYTIDKFENLKVKILAKPLVFDRGIFDDKPTYIYGTQYKDSPESFAEWYQYTQNHTNYQAFYNYNRDYGKLYELEDNNEKLTDKEKLIIRLKRDRKIKQNQMQDLFLKLIAEKLGGEVFNSSKEESVSIPLSDIFTSQAERINQRADAISQSKREKGDHSENRIKESSIWSKTFAYEQGQIREPAVKLKDFGKFRQLLEDSRVDKIFSYNTSKIWTKIEIEEEIQQYEIIRREFIFKEIHNFEAYLWKREGTKVHPSDFGGSVGIPKFRKYIEKGVLNKLRGKSGIQESDKDWLPHIDFGKDNVESLSQQKPIVQKAFFLILLRNKFAHNQLIELEYWNQLQKVYKPYDLNEFKSISYYLLQVVKSFIVDMKEELQK